MIWWHNVHYEDSEEVFFLYWGFLSRYSFSFVGKSVITPVAPSLNALSNSCSSFNTHKYVWKRTNYYWFERSVTVVTDFFLSIKSSIFNTILPECMYVLVLLSKANTVVNPNSLYKYHIEVVSYFSYLNASPF